MELSVERIAAAGQQRRAAHDSSKVVRVVGGPGTGKTHTVAERVCHVLRGGANPRNVYVVSLTPATAAELQGRIAERSRANAGDVADGPTLLGRLFQRAGDLARDVAARARNRPPGWSESGGPGMAAGNATGAQNADDTGPVVSVFTMDSLALRILEHANLLDDLYPGTPAVLDDWEQRQVYDQELAASLKRTPGRAAALRRAHNASWQTLKSDELAEQAIADDEQAGFDEFHRSRSRLYCWALPGELTRICLEALQTGRLRRSGLPAIEHLIVDEYQDFNACEQALVRLLASAGATLFVAGDDDQSICAAVRHANPAGLVQFADQFPGSTTHLLRDSFRCTPSVLAASNRLLHYNVRGLAKEVVALYASALPPLNGSLQVWGFPTAEDEFRAIAESCRSLIEAGMSGQEDEIVILLVRRKPSIVQLDPIVQELENLGVPYDAPSDPDLADDAAIRAAYSLLRITRDTNTATPDYPAHRDILALLSGVGTATGKAIAELCLQNDQDFRDLFYLAAPPGWLPSRYHQAWRRVVSVVQVASELHLDDPIDAASITVADALKAHVFAASNQAAERAAAWESLISTLPPKMTIAELLEYLAADEAGRRESLRAVEARLRPGAAAGGERKRVRISTIQAAKGLSGKVVFIPSAEHGIIPSHQAFRTVGVGALLEERRLFYVALTRAQAACIVSFALIHTGPAAYVLERRDPARLGASIFVRGEIGCQAVNRGGGLTRDEAEQIVADVERL